MTAPSLADLRDIHLPPPPFAATLLPEGWSAVALAAVVLVLFAVLIWAAHRFVRRRRLRRALRELARLAAAHRRDGDETRLARGVSRLVREYAMACFPHAGVAALTGDDWLRFLDSHGGAGSFLAGAGAALASRPYRDSGALDAAALLAAVRRWLEANPS